MAINSVTDTSYTRARENLAATGLVVIGVEFRNAGGRLGPHPFPAGLNDCASAIRWVYANRADLGISHLITCGESGGGNLTLTTVHKAKREGWLNEIAGAYAQCPFLSGRWYEQPDDLPSLKEADGYLLTREIDGTRGFGVRPGRRELARRRLLRRMGDRRGAERPSAAYYFGQRDGPAARRGAALLPQAGARRSARGRPRSGRHRPRLAT